MESPQLKSPKKHKKSSKKPKKTPQNLTTLVTQFKEQPESKNPPILTYTATGFDPLPHNNVGSNEVKFYRNQARNKARRVELVVKKNGSGSKSGSGVDYVGTSYSGEAGTGTMCGFVLGVVERGSGNFSVVPVSNCKVLRLLPLARAAQISEKEPDTPAKIDTAEEKRQKTNELTSLYGTKSAKQKDMKLSRLHAKEDPNSLEELNHAIENTEVDKSALAPKSEISRDVPPHDLSADTPEKAYLLDKIIPKGEWDYLNDILELSQAGQEIRSDVYPRFVCNRFYKLALLQDGEEKRKVAGILSYISHLINFKNHNTLDGRSSSSKHSKFVPGILSQKFNMMFVDSDKNRLADDKIPSLIGYVLVLTLFVDEFETDFTDIANDLKMQPLAIRPYLLNLGCQLKRQGTGTVAILSAPLKFPEIRRKRRRG